MSYVSVFDSLTIIILFRELVDSDEVDDRECDDGVDDGLLVRLESLDESDM